MTDGLIALLKKAEEFRAEPYLCPAGYPTQGYGRRVRSLNLPAITEETAERWLKEDAAFAEREALRLSPILKDHPNRLAAITDFIFNLGPGAYQFSTLRKRVDAGEWLAAAEHLKKWVHAKVGGKMVVLGGLVQRRAVAADWMVRG